MFGIFKNQQEIKNQRPETFHDCASDCRSVIEGTGSEQILNTIDVMREKGLKPKAEQGI